MNFQICIYKHTCPCHMCYLKKVKQCSLFDMNFQQYIGVCTHDHIIREIL